MLSTLGPDYGKEKHTMTRLEQAEISRSGLGQWDNVGPGFFHLFHPQLFLLNGVFTMQGSNRNTSTQERVSKPPAGSGSPHSTFHSCQHCHIAQDSGLFLNAVSGGKSLTGTGAAQRDQPGYKNSHHSHIEWLLVAIRQVPRDWK